MKISLLVVVAAASVPGCARGFTAYPSSSTRAFASPRRSRQQLSVATNGASYTYTYGNTAYAPTGSSNAYAPTSAAPTTTTVAQVPKVAQRWRKSTKQVVTLGPASSTKEMIEKLFLAGADVFRLNFSHGSQEQKLELLLMIREIEEKYNHPIAVLGDLQGPKLRVRVPMALFTWDTASLTCASLGRCALPDSSLSFDSC
jgi:pyruvate kinase